MLVLHVQGVKLNVEHAEHIVVVGAPVDVILDVPVDAWVVVMWLVPMVVEIIVLVLALVHVRGTVREIAQDHVVHAHTTVVMGVPVGVTVVVTQVVMEVARVIVMVNVPHAMAAVPAEDAITVAVLDVIQHAMQVPIQVYK